MDQTPERKSGEKSEKPEVAKKRKSDIVDTSGTSTARFFRLVASVRSTMGEIESDYVAKEKDRRLLAGQLDKWVKDNESLEDKNKDLEDKHRSLQEHNASLKRKFGNLDWKYNALKIDHKDCGEKYKSLQKTNAALDDKNDSLLDERDAQRMKLQELREKLDAEKRRNKYYSKSDVKTVSEMLEKNRGWIEKFEKLEKEASVAFSEMNKFRRLAGRDQVDREEFETIIGEDYA